VTAAGVRRGVEATATTIRIPGPLRGLSAGAGDVEVRAATVGGALDELVRRHPGLLRHLRTETGSLREHVNVYLNQDDIRTLRGEATALAAGDTITVVPSIAGG
jgi:sulfur-carrier protein